MLAIAAIIWTVFICTPLSYYYGQPLRVRSRPERSDVIALMSSGAIDQRWITPDAAQRTLGALRLYREGFGHWIISSGSNPDQGLHQAENQAVWLEDAGIPRDHIVVENRSSRTYHSIVEISKLMREHGWKSVVVVTSELDIPRVRLVCQAQHVDASFLAVPEFARPNGPFYLRQGFSAFYHASYEYAGLFLYKFKGWI